MNYEVPITGFWVKPGMTYYCVIRSDQFLQYFRSASHLCYLSKIRICI